MGNAGFFAPVFVAFFSEADIFSNLLLNMFNLVM